MPPRRPELLPFTVALVATLLTGCTPATPAPTPSPTATRLYSSEEEALTAAQKAYAKYIDVSNQVAHDGWVDLSPLKEVATGDALKADRKSGEAARAKSIHMVGDLAGDVKRIQEMDAQSVTAYVCLNVSETRFLNDDGEDTTSGDRDSAVPLEIRFVRPTDVLLVGRTDQWTESSFC